MDAEKDARQDRARQAVGRYYDRNTRGFLSSGEGGKSLAIHRGIWAPGIADAAQASEYVPALILEQAKAIGARDILDLGCGVGGSCIFLADGLGAQGPRIIGMTISGAQVRLGRALLARRGLEGAVRLFEGDYCDPASFAGLPSLDLVLALESLLHSPNLSATLANASAALKMGGRLIICDDMIMADPGPRDRDLADFRRCWHAYGLSTRDELQRLCRGLGLEPLADEDLSPMLRLFRPRDNLAALFLPALRLFRNWPWAQNLVGGTALQRLLARGIVAYRYQVWVKAR